MDIRALSAQRARRVRQVLKVPRALLVPQVLPVLRALRVLALTTRELSPQPPIFPNPPLRLLPTLLKTKRQSTSTAPVVFGKTSALFKVQKALKEFRVHRVCKVFKVKRAFKDREASKEFRV
jgi:hypothetical protein